MRKKVEARRKEERERGRERQSDSSPRCPDCQAPLSTVTLLCDRNARCLAREWRRKLEGGGERVGRTLSPPPLSSSVGPETEREKEERQSDSQTRRPVSTVSVPVLLHCPAQQGQRQRERKGRETVRQSDKETSVSTVQSARLPVLLHCPAQSGQRQRERKRRETVRESDKETAVSTVQTAELLYQPWPFSVTWVPSVWPDRQRRRKLGGGERVCRPPSPLSTVQSSQARDSQEEEKVKEVGGRPRVCQVQVLLHCLGAGREGDPEHAELQVSLHIDHLHSALYIPVTQSPLGWPRLPGAGGGRQEEEEGEEEKR